MSLLDVLRSGVKIADSVTKPLQSTVTLEHYISASDGYGPISYTSAAQLPAIVDWKQQQVRTSAGVMALSRAVVTFLDVAALAAATNGEGINDQDLITLPDGSSGPILNMSGFIDAGTKKPVAMEVFLG